MRLEVTNNKQRLLKLISNTHKRYAMGMQSLYVSNGEVSILGFNTARSSLAGR